MIAIRAVKDEIGVALKKANGKPNAAALPAEGNALVAKASGIEGVPMQVNIKGSEVNLNFRGIMPFALVVTLAMPGMAEVYAQARNRVVIKPKVLVAL